MCSFVFRVDLYCGYINNNYTSYIRNFDQSKKFVRLNLNVLK